MTAVVVGVDGGGTKTDVIVADRAGVAQATVLAGGTNHEMIGLDAMVEVLGPAVAEALAAAGATGADVVASVFGLAGVDWPSDVGPIDAALSQLGLGGQRAVMNDSQLALRAGCTQSWGVVSNVGTGSVTAGRNREGRWFRTMAVGWGEPSGAGTIVRDALDAVAAHHHCTAPPTALSEALPAALGFSDALAMFEAISRGRTDGLRALAPVVTAIADRGDEVARVIIADVASRHAEMVSGVVRCLEMGDDDFEVVTAGSVHRAGGLFCDVFVEMISSRFEQAMVVPLTTTPAIGAVQLALDLIAEADAGPSTA